METPDKAPSSEDPPAEELGKSRVRKAYLAIVGLLLAFLFLSAMVGSHIFLILNGKIASTVIKDSAIAIDDVTIYLLGNTSSELQKLYTENSEKEFKLCLTGRRQGNLVNVTGLYMPVTYSRTPVSVEAQVCSGETVIELHTHPMLHCIFSDQDLKSFDEIREENHEIIMGLMCDRDRFSFVY